MMKKILYILWMSLLLSPCFAAPNITNVGSVVDGENVTIAGTLFGTKSTAAPISFVNADGKTVDAAVSETGWTDESTKYTYSSTSHSKNRSLYCSISKNPDMAHFYYDLGVAGEEEIYFTFWTKVHFVNVDTTAQGGSQLKWWSIRTGTVTSTSGWGGYPFVQKDDEVVTWLSAKDSTINASGGYKDTYYWTDDAPTQNTWIRIEAYVKRNSVDDAADGTWLVKYIMPDDSSSYTVLDTTTYVTHDAGADELRYPGFRHDITNTLITDAETNIWIDDIYVDTTQSRVEIGNASTWAACTHREIQIPTAWESDGTEIIITINQGSFTDGSTAYLFVVDSDGSVSDGEAITFGTESSTPNLTGVSGSGFNFY